MQQSNQLITGDCLTALRTSGDGCCQLVYLDPPFNTNVRRVGGLRNAERVGAAGNNVPAGGRGGSRTAPTYPDSFGAPESYVAYMRPRVEQLRRVLTPDGSLFFHCDWRMAHHVRLLLDEVFGAAGVFVNEIVWHYGLGAARARRQLLTKHDVIFWYARSRQYTFHLLRAEPTPAMQAKYRHVDEQGNRYMNSYGKRYLLKGGKPLDDVWDIPAIAPTSAERVGYPTQKPLALLARIVQLASNEGDCVLDPFCGSGTTLVAAQQLGRRWIGIDSNPQAIEIAGERLKNGRQSDS
jgi:site-specific DNA-methyltransferase (adenine-specific)